MTEELIKRLEAATGPCRELDRAIVDAVRGKPKPGFQNGRIEPYTASIDAALTLRPDGALYAIETYDSNGVYPEHVRASAWVQGAARAFAATPALAIVIAALRAKAGEAV